METPETHYAKTDDGVHIAYQVRGSGPVDLIWAGGWVGNFEVDLENAGFAPFCAGLAAFSRLIQFDKRGAGLSDRTRTPDLEKRADDLLAVLDAVGSERAVILGAADGGALAVFFAASHPERVQALILKGPSARTAWAPDYPWGVKEEEYLADREDLVRRWGSIELAQEWAEREAPSSAHDAEFVQWFAKSMRHGASPRSVVEFHDMNFAIDVRSVLAGVQAPTLVIAIPGSDELFPGAEGAVQEHYVADRIPGAKYIELPGRDWMIEITDPQPLLREIERFIGSVSAEEAQFDRVLATVLFTDIVGSTEKATALGDAEWKDVLERHHATVRAMIGRYRGTEVNTTGDGFLATFDGPARGVRCAQAIAEAVRPLGLEIRAGLHTGEVETIDGTVGGLAVHIGARVGALAGPSEVLVSQTVKDLVAGSDLTFESAGEHDLKGVPDRWHLYHVVKGPLEK